VRHAKRLVIRLSVAAVPREVFHQVLERIGRAPSSTRVANILEVIRGEDKHLRARCVPGEFEGVQT